MRLHEMKPEWKQKLGKRLAKTSMMQNLKAKKPGFKVLYLTAVLVVTLGFFIHLTVNLIRYLSKPVITERMREGISAQFPVVVLCPEAPLSHHKRARTSVVRNGVDYPMWKVTLNADRYWRYVSGLPMDFSTAKWDSDDLERVSVRPFIEESKGMRTAQDFVMDCKYMGKPCSFQNFTTLYHPDLLTCSAFTLTTTRSISGTGIDTGLQLMLYTKDFSAMLQKDEMLRLYAGFHVFVVENSSKPLDLAQTATFAATGYHTKIGFTSTHYSKLSSEKSMCNITIRNESTIYSGYNLKSVQSLPYTGKLCQDDQFQKALFEKCGCYSQTHYLLQNDSIKMDDFCLNIPTELLLVEKWFHNDTNVWVQSKKDGPTKMLTQFKATIDKGRDRMNCMKEMQMNWRSREKEEFMCHTPCDFTDFALNIHKSIWPYRALYAAKPIKEAMENALQIRANLSLPIGIWETLYKFLDIKNNSRMQDVDVLRDRFLLLDIYPNSPTTDKIYEDWAYPPVALLSDLGGIMGLWLGMSILAMIEIGELLMIPCHVFLCGDNVDDDESDEPIKSNSIKPYETSNADLSQSKNAQHTYDMT